ncbi:MAG TPA: hypothetical protein VK963_00125 [Candidatus Saccharimonadales bacterium]|nr:hypothetical protein [Candidatus Saccharimonadales bacterium]
MSDTGIWDDGSDDSGDSMEDAYEVVSDLALKDVLAAIESGRPLPMQLSEVGGDDTITRTIFLKRSAQAETDIWLVEGRTTTGQQALLTHMDPAVFEEDFAGWMLTFNRSFDKALQEFTTS